MKSGPGRTTTFRARRLRRFAAAVFGLASLLTVAGGVILPGGAPSAAEASPSPQPDSAPGSPAFSLPVDGPLLRGFDPPDHAWLAGHRGVDLAASTGATVRAAGAGVVAFAGVVVDRPVVSIDHAVGIRTTYEAVHPAVSRGEAVDAGDPIGTLHPGNAHCPAPCLHWGARIGADTYIDPLRLLQPPTIRLYPPLPW